MIPKGNQRAGGQQLATHLLNAYDNDSVEVADVRGAIAQDLHGAFAEWYAEAKATKCSKFLYSLSINPDHTQGPYNREHYYDFIRRTEDMLGLSGQPRAVVFHVKHGREHCHVVWSRIDTEKMKAVQLSHDRQKLRAVAQEFARDHNLTLPPGMQNNRGKDRFPDHAKTENLAEKQQEERTGISKEQRMEEIAKAWRKTPMRAVFVKALEDSGYFLARGDKRAYVVVDLYGEVHSLSRQLTGMKSKELKARLADYPLDKLMDVETAQDRARAATAGAAAQAHATATGPRGTLGAEPAANTADSAAAPRRPATGAGYPAGKSGIETPAARRAPQHRTQGACRYAKRPQRRRCPRARRETSHRRSGLSGPRHRLRRPRRFPSRPGGSAKEPWNNGCKPQRSPAATGAKCRISGTRSAPSSASISASSALWR